MKDVYPKVQPACDPKGVLSAEASVGVINKRLEAYNRDLMVSVPCDMPDFAVPAADFDFAMRKYEDPSIKITDKTVMLAGKTRLKRLADKIPLRRPDATTNKIGNVPDLLEVIDEVFPFTVGDPARPWSAGARFDGTTVTATNSVMLVQAELDADVGLEGVTLSRSVLSYIRLRREALTGWTISDRGLVLDFDDGSWAVAARMAMEMPDQAVNLLQVISSWDDLQGIDDAYRNAVLTTSEWTTDEISIHADKIAAGRWTTDHSEPAKSILSSEQAVFSASDLATVITRAEHIGFDRYPNPVPFITKRGSKGLIAGRS